MAGLGLRAVAVALSACGCMAKPHHLIYPQDVTFTGWHNPDFEICSWGCAPNNPKPCPLVVHLPTGDLGDKELADAIALRRAGWEERVIGNGRIELVLRAKPPLVRCWYQGGVLVGVEVNTLPGNGGGPGVLSIDGKKVTLPSKDEGIIQALGQPLRRD